MSGYVYLICDNITEKYKIGVTKQDINKRLKKLQTGNSTELFVRHYYKTDYPFRMEKMLHNKFNHKRILNEWFDLDDDVIINFPKYCQEVEKQINALKENPFFAKDLK